LLALNKRALDTKGRRKRQNLRSLKSLTLK